MWNSYTISTVLAVLIQEMWSQRRDILLLGERREDGNVVVTRDGSNYMEHFNQQARMLYPTEIPGARRGIRWWDQDGER